MCLHSCFFASIPSIVYIPWTTFIRSWLLECWSTHLTSCSWNAEVPTSPMAVGKLKYPSLPRLLECWSTHIAPGCWNAEVPTSPQAVRALKRQVLLLLLLQLELSPRHELTLASQFRLENEYAIEVLKYIFFYNYYIIRFFVSFYMTWYYLTYFFWLDMIMTWYDFFYRWLRN